MKKKGSMILSVKKIISTPYLFLCIIITALMLLFSGIIDTSILPNRVQQGTAHLANVGSRKPAMLNGTWEYYAGQFLFSSNFTGGEVLPDVQYVKVPGRSPNALGYGTYRMTFDFISGNQLFALKIADIRSSARIYVDGELISNVGFTSALHESSEPSKETQYVIFPLDIMKKNHELIIQIANYEYFESGITSPIYFGTQSSVYRLASQFRFSESISIISIGFLAVLLILLLCLRIQMGNNLYLLLFTLCFAFYLFGIGQELILSPISSIFYIIFIRLSILSYLGLGIFMTLFLNPNEHNSKDVMWPFRFLKYVCPVMAAAGIIVQTEWLYGYYLAAVCYFVLSLLFCFYILLKRMLTRRQSAYIQMLALTIFSAFFILQYCYRQGYVTGERYTGCFTFFVVSYVILQLSYVALRVSRIYTGNARLAQQMVVSDKMKDELMTITSHELRTPLHGMINILESMSSNLDAAERGQQKNTLPLALTLARRMHSTVNDLYGFHDNTSALKPSLKPHNLKIEADAVIEVFYYTKNNANVAIFNHMAPETALVMADEAKLWQILTNLTSNAVKYTPKGQIILSSCKWQDKIKISVTDSGIGMKHSETTHIFETATRLKEGARLSGGLGMGLYIARQLVEQMNGNIWVEWSHPNQGTCISFTLDMCTQAEYAASKAEPIEKNISQTAGEHYIDVLHPEKANILAIDDNKDNLDIIESTFDDCSYVIQTAQTADKAKELLNTGSYDIVILDVMMPDSNGFEFCRAIRSKFTHFELPVLLLTARDKSEDVLTGFWSGANDYIIKPADRVELRARVFSLIALHQSVNSAIESELEFLHAQIKPHFLYNAFNTISAVALTDGYKASELIDDLGTYLRSCFSKGSSRSDIITLEEEMAMVEAYIRIEKARFGERLAVEMIKETDDSFGLPLLSLQPIVENAVRHGSLHGDGVVKVKIIIRKAKPLYVIKIIDNGCGFAPEAIASVLSGNDTGQPPSGGIGLKNVNRRLNLYYNLPLTIENLKEGGSCVSIRIPVKR